MISKKLKNRILKISRKYIPLSKDFIHLSFIVKRNKILAYSTNNPKKTHTKAIVYEYPFIHSEFAVCLKESDYSKCILVNIRINKNGNLLNSKPCPVCHKLICKCRFKKVFYSTINDFVQYGPETLVH